MHKNLNRPTASPTKASTFLQRRAESSLPGNAATSAFAHDFSKIPVLQRKEGNGLGGANTATPDATRVAHPDRKQIEAMLGPKKKTEVEDLGDMMSAALNPSTDTMHIAGTAREYFKQHKTTEAIRDRFLSQVEETIRHSKHSSGKWAGTYHAGLAHYGGKMWDFSPSNLFSKGTWMIGKNDEPLIRYDVSYRRVARADWVFDWKATWKIRDNFDLKPGSDQTPFYNTVAKPLSWAWHDKAGAKSPAPVSLDWTESGTRKFGDPPKTGTAIRTLRPGDVRKW
jgi:hypothetical protein